MATRQLPRRKAAQARSKATVKRILDAAVSLIRERDPGPVTVTEIARRADVVIGSVYQYFDDRSAINRALLVRHYDEVRSMLQTSLADVRDYHGLLDALESVASRYYSLHQNDPFYNGIWSAVQTDAKLQALDVQDTVQNATYLAGVLRALLPQVDEDELMASCALLLQFAAATGRFARQLSPGLKRRTLPIYKRILRGCLKSLFAANCRNEKLIKERARKPRARVRSF